MRETEPATNVAAVSLVTVLVAALFAANVGVVGVASAAGNAPICEEVSYQGSGVESDPYEVSTLAQLQCMGDRDSETTTRDVFELQADVDASDTAEWNEGAGFDPVGSLRAPFTGTFDGDNHTISGLTIDRPGENRVGLFGASGGTIEHVRLENVTVTGGDRTGGTVGLVDSDLSRLGVIKEPRGPLEGGRTVRNVSVTGSVSGAVTVGGLAGMVRNDRVVRSSADADVQGDVAVGGLIGAARSSEVVDSSANGTVQAGSGEFGHLTRFEVVSYAGGLIGSQRRGTVTRSVASGDVTASAPVAGGLVGFTLAGTVSETAATGNVEGTEYVGGLLGGLGEETVASPALVNESYATGDVTGTNRTGGLVGSNRDTGDGATVNRTYAAGTVTAGGPASGGLVGQNVGGTVLNSYWSGELSGESHGIGFDDGTNRNLVTVPADGMTGLAAPQFMGGNLDFAGTWTFGPRFPPLRFQAPNVSVAVTATNSPVTAGETLEVTAVVTNHDEVSVAADVFGWFQSDVHAVAPTETIPPGGSDSVTLAGFAAALEPGTYTTAVATTNASTDPIEFVVEEQGKTEQEDEPSVGRPTEDGPADVSIEPDAGSTGDGDEGESEEGDGEETGASEPSGEDATEAVRTAQHGNRTEVSAVVADADAGTEVSLDVDAAGGADGVALQRIAVTPAADGTFRLELVESPEALEGTPAFTRDDGTVPLSYFRVDHTLPNAEIEEVAFTYEVETEQLERLGASPEDVSLFRLEGGSWVEHDTQVVGVRDGTATLRTPAPGLSKWTAAVKRPVFTVTDTAVDRGTATTDEPVTIRASVANTGGTEGVYEARLVLDGEVVDRRERAVPPGGTVAVTFERSFDRPGRHEVRVNEAFAGQIEISSAAEPTAVETVDDAADVPANASRATPAEPEAGGESIPVLLLGVAILVLGGIAVWGYARRTGE